jgi:hypothetical protein
LGLYSYFTCLATGLFSGSLLSDFLKLVWASSLAGGFNLDEVVFLLLFLDWPGAVELP